MKKEEKNSPVFVWSRWRVSGARYFVFWVGANGMICRKIVGGWRNIFVVTATFLGVSLFCWVVWGLFFVLLGARICFFVFGVVLARFIFI
jgi:hypothetical protein